jgi:hypothetical protein
MFDALFHTIIKKEYGSASSNRLPRECGDPGKRRFHEVVNNIISIEIDPFGELFIYWIPAFARKTCGVSLLVLYKPNQ